MKDEFGGKDTGWKRDDVERLTQQVVGQQSPVIQAFFTDYLRDRKPLDIEGILAKESAICTSEPAQAQPGQTKVGADLAPTVLCCRYRA